MRDKDTNPFDLKNLNSQPKDYLDTNDFSKFLKKKNISVREDNLPRFADRHGIKMAKKTREGSGGSVPTIYKIPTKAKLEEIIKNMSLSNNNSLGKENIKKKEKKILEIFDKAENQKESKSSIADKVAKVLGVPCNRKLVRRVLNKKRSSKLNKLKNLEIS
tara:strand:- start:127 stop:609 length:483 start_codon:yes stop_codon:yes gene_type:complete